MSSYDIICSSSDRERWLEERRKGIGASEAAAVLGVSRWRTPLSVYVKKLGLDEDTEQSEAARWGTLLEPIVAEEYLKERGRTGEPHGELLRSKARPWQLATLDWVQHAADREGPGLLEVKTTGNESAWSEGPPVDVLLQFQQQLAVTGWGWGSVAVLFGGFGGFHSHWVDVERNEDLIGYINEGEAEFMERVRSETPPDPDGHKATTEALKLLYPKPDETTIQLNGDLHDVDYRRQEIAEQIKKLTEERAGIDNRIKAAIGSASVGVLGDVAYHWRADKRGTRSLRRVEVQS